MVLAEDTYECVAEDTYECVGGTVVVAVDTDPGDIRCTGPPRGDRPGARFIRLERPQPGNVVRALAAKQRYDVSQGCHES